MTKSLRSSRKAATVWIIVCFFVVLAGLGTVFKFYSGFPRAAAPDIFIDATEASGIHFVHTNGMTGEYYFAEIIGSGVAIFDYDNDGRPDILVLDGAPLEKATSGNAASTCSARLYHNDMTVTADGQRILKFTDVTERSGLCS